MDDRGWNVSVGIGAIIGACVETKDTSDVVRIVQVGVIRCCIFVDKVVQSNEVNWIK